MNKKESDKESAFDSAVDRLVARWPHTTRSITIDTSRTRTHALFMAGDGVPVVLLPGGGTTGASWAAVARHIGHRPVIAPDIPGDAGRTTLDSAQFTPAQMHEWFDEVLTSLHTNQIDLVGHSYGGWLAVSYALARGGKVRDLTLIAPSNCFASLSLRYIAHALPVLLRPSERSARRLITWETAGNPPDQVSADVYVAAAGRRWMGAPRPTRPHPTDLENLDVTAVNLVLADADRSHNNSTCATNARQCLSHVGVTTIPDASHHSVLDRGAETIASLLTTEQR